MQWNNRIFQRLFMRFVNFSWRCQSRPLSHFARTERMESENENFLIKIRSFRFTSFALVWPFEIEEKVNSIEPQMRLTSSPHNGSCFRFQLASLNSHFLSALPFVFFLFVVGLIEIDEISLRSTERTIFRSEKPRWPCLHAADNNENSTENIG